MRAALSRLAARLALLASFGLVAPAAAEGFEPSGLDDYIGVKMGLFSYSFEYQGKSYPLAPLIASDASFYDLLRSYEPIAARVEGAESILGASRGMAMAGVGLGLAGIALSFVTEPQELIYVATASYSVGLLITLLASIKASSGVAELLSAVSEWNQRAWHNVSKDYP